MVYGPVSTNILAMLDNIHLFDASFEKFEFDKKYLASPQTLEYSLA